MEDPLRRLQLSHFLFVLMCPTCPQLAHFLDVPWAPFWVPLPLALGEPGEPGSALPLGWIPFSFSRCRRRSLLRSRRLSSSKSLGSNVRGYVAEQDLNGKKGNHLAFALLSASASPVGLRSWTLRNVRRQKASEGCKRTSLSSCLSADAP